jgi:histidinol-phosphate aminotransferase
VIRFNSNLDSVPGYHPGSPKGRTAGQVQDSEVAQLASNESPLPPLDEVVEAISRAAGATNRYPDPEATELREALAAWHGVEPDQIAVGNGSCEILVAAGQAMLSPGREIVYAWPSFSIYPTLAPLNGGTEVRVPLAPGDFHDLPAMLERIGPSTAMVIVCNPNNPTATYRPADEIAEFVRSVPDEVAVILDEAYIDFQDRDDPEASLGLFRERENLIVLRTFSKSHSLAGFRVGYAICPPAFKAAVDAVRQPFPVNVLAQAAATESLRHDDAVRERIAGVIGERARIQEALAASGIEASDSQANFSWVTIGDRIPEAEVVAAMAEKGILVRAGSVLGSPGHLRVSYGTPSEDDRMIEVLRSVLGA